jgi:hypothetical protein
MLLSASHQHRLRYKSPSTDDCHSKVIRLDTVLVIAHILMTRNRLEGHLILRLQQGQIRADPENRQDQLTRPDPTLLYAEVPLFEDKLHDNGSSNLLVRIVSVFLDVTCGS